MNKYLEKIKTMENLKSEHEETQLLYNMYHKLHCPKCHTPLEFILEDNHFTFGNWIECGECDYKELIKNVNFFVTALMFAVIEKWNDYR